MSDKALKPVLQHGLIILGALAIIWIGTMDIKRRHHQRVRAGEIHERRTEDVLFLSSVIGTNEKLVKRSLDRRYEREQTPITIARGKVQVSVGFKEGGARLLSEENKAEMRAMFGAED